MVHIKCANGYQKTAQSYPDIIQCTKFGKWNFPIYKCEPICGKIQDTNNEKNVNKESIKDFPWHANIYVKSTIENNYMYICGGTIINSRVIVSGKFSF